MFTGLIEEVGTVQALARTGGTLRITVSSKKLTQQLKLGDSISVSGVCLTALNIGPGSFDADLAAETVARTSLSGLKQGALVNLELPTRAGAPLGGHVVQGHVDGTGRLLGLEQIPRGEDFSLVVELPAGLEKYVVAKGSIAIEGISLTVAKIDARTVTIAVIPHTYAATNLPTLNVGDPVNIEVDVLAKYAEKLHREESHCLTIDQLLTQGF